MEKLSLLECLEARAIWENLIASQPEVKNEMDFEEFCGEIVAELP